jgi:hypothetical protein
MGGVIYYPYYSGAVKTGAHYTKWEKTDLEIFLMDFLD